MRVICLKKRWKHHAAGSGYDRLADYLDATVVPRQDLTSRPGRLAAKLWDKVAGSPPYLLDYRLGDRIAEEKAFWLALRARADIIHVLYGDEQLDVLLRRASYVPGRVIATFHLPAARVRERFETIQRAELQRLAGAVVVSASEVAAFSDWLGPEKVMYVPHGIDTASFRASRGPVSGRLRLLFVGAHMRDFDVTHRVVDLCTQEGIDVAFDIVVPEYYRGYFTGCEGVTLHSGIDDAALRKLYGEATALFLPLVNATANNAILESLASGTPVISTDVGGIRDYVDQTCGWLLPPGDVASAFALVRSLAADPEQAVALRANARLRAERLSWEHVADQLRGGYRRVCSGGHFAAGPEPQRSTVFLPPAATAAMAKPPAA